MCYDRDIIDLVFKDRLLSEQLNTEVTHLNEEDITKTDQQDTTRAYMMEQTYHKINIYSVTKPKTNIWKFKKS